MSQPNRKSKIAHLAGPTATIQNSPPLVTLQQGTAQVRAAAAQEPRRQRPTLRIRKGDVEIPSDLYGVIYTELDDGDGWKLKLVRELKTAGLDFDASRMWA
jgi:hypothetical protein